MTGPAALPNRIQDPDSRESRPNLHVIARRGGIRTRVRGSCERCGGPVENPQRLRCLPCAAIVAAEKANARASRRRSADMRRNARRNGIAMSETMVWGSCVLAMDVSGSLYRWMANRWVRLEPVSTGIRRAARAVSGLAESQPAHAGGRP
jgi:hypothetical protein